MKKFLILSAIINIPIIAMSHTSPLNVMFKDPANLMNAVISKNPKAVSAILDDPYNAFNSSVSTELDKKYMGKSALHLAARYRLDEIVSILLTKRTDKVHLEYIDDKGQTPLHEAVQANANIIVQKFMDAGADPFCKDYDGKTAYDYANPEIKIILKKENKD